MPLVPTSPSTCPGLGVGSRTSLNELALYRKTVSFYMFLGRLMILMARKGHFFTHSPQPMHSTSEIMQILDYLTTSMQSLSDLLIGQFFLHSCLQRLGLQRSAFTMAILSLDSSISTTN